MDVDGHAGAGQRTGGSVPVAGGVRAAPVPGAGRRLSRSAGGAGARVPGRGPRQPHPQNAVQFQLGLGTGLPHRRTLVLGYFTGFLSVPLVFPWFQSVSSGFTGFYLVYWFLLGLTMCSMVL